MVGAGDSGIAAGRMDPDGNAARQVFLLVASGFHP